jgi:high-affinity iron transporter
MTLLHRFLMMTCLIVALLITATGYAADLATEEKAKQIWQLLDYVAVDYGAAVSEGKITNHDEYAEMLEFAQTAQRQLGGLPDTMVKSQLQQQAAALASGIARKAPPKEVADHARALAKALLVAYPVLVAPSKPPNLQRGATLYQAQCASCHGAQGKGDGPLAATLTPPPIAFTDRERAGERSLFALHQTITRGVEGTSMPAFAALPDEDRWALSFFISTMAFGEDERQTGARMWKTDQALHITVPSLAVLTQLSESALAKTLPAQQASAVLAYLRNDPDALDQSKGTQLLLAKARLKESLAALENGDAVKATRLALSAYLDGFEPVEPALAIKDKPLFTDIEKAMGAYRAAAWAGKLAEARQIEAQLQSRLNAAQDALNAVDDDPLGVFVGALTILLREGVEALLVIVAMIAFLKKANRRDVLPVVHAGWVLALLAGGLTWYAATYLVDISGASRELTEGFSAIFAAVVLLSVGIWMHQKSLAGRWQTYIRDKLTSALGKQSAIMLFLLAFVTVYREVFETVLFYAALWTPGNGLYLLAGLGIGIVILGGIAWMMLRTSTRLPIGRFFAVSAALVAVLAVVLIGKGVAALQEAGLLDITPIAGPSIDLLGIYPSLQTVMAQMIVALIVLISMVLNARSQKAG